MLAFLDWFNKPTKIDEVLKSGIAHFWFVTIHPFDDKNGRIARTIADMSLARSEKSSLGTCPWRFIERTTNYGFKPITRRLRRKPDDIQVCKTREVLSGYSTARHLVSGGARHFGAKSGRRAKHKLCHALSRYRYTASQGQVLFPIR
jgi:hypothetical protein